MTTADQKNIRKEERWKKLFLQILTKKRKKFLFVTEEEDGDSEAYILKEIADENDDVVYEMVEDDNELAALGKVFAELIDDADIEY